MKKRNFKVYASTIIGITVAMLSGIVNNGGQANGVGEDLFVQIGIICLWAWSIILPFLKTFIITFVAMFIWQKVHHKSFMSAREKFFQWWDKVMKGVEEATTC